MNRPDFIQHFGEAIAIFEGYMDKKFIPIEKNIAFRQNNPGNLRFWGNKVPRKNGYAFFPTPSEGWRALYVQIGKNIDRGLTLREFFGGKFNVYGGYAPAKDKNKPVDYAKFVAGYLRGFTPRVQGIDQVISSMIDQEINDAQSAG